MGAIGEKTPLAQLDFAYECTRPGDSIEAGLDSPDLVGDHAGSTGPRLDPRVRQKDAFLASISA